MNWCIPSIAYLRLVCALDLEQALKILIMFQKCTFSTLSGQGAKGSQESMRKPWACPCKFLSVGLVISHDRAWIRVAVSGVWYRAGDWCDQPNVTNLRSEGPSAEDLACETMLTLFPLYHTPTWNNAFRSRGEKLRQHSACRHYVSQAGTAINCIYNSSNKFFIHHMVMIKNTDQLTLMQKWLFKHFT